MGKHIFLIGFMGTGKTAVSTALGKRMKLSVLDTDKMIEEQQNMTIPEIFATYGEEYFRDLESKLLEELQTVPDAVVSCGGGLALREKNAELMRQTGMVVWLKATKETIYARVKNSTNRPLLNGNMNPEYIGNLLEVRKPNYERCADVSVKTDGKKIEDIVKEIQQEWKK